MNRTTPDFREKVMLVAGVTLLIGTAVLIVWLAVEVLFLLFGAILLAILLRAIANQIGVWTGLNRGLSLAVTLIGLIGLTTGLVLLLAPHIGSQMSELADRLPASVDRLRSSLGESSLGAMLLEQVPSFEELRSRNLGFSRVTGFFSSTIGLLLNMVLLVVIAVYGAARPEVYRSGLQRLFPKQLRQRVGEVIEEVTIALRWWMVGQIGAMFLVGTLTAIGLWLLGIPLALSLGLITALLTFIPNFGPAISVVPPALLGLMDGPATMAYVLILYIGIQFVESNFITPQIHRKTVNLPPALTISTQLLAGLLFGLPGLIFATPLTAAAMVIVRMVYIEDQLDDPVSLPSDEHGAD